MWGNKIFFKLFEIETIFIVGSSKFNTINERIKNESEIYKDIIQVEIIDHYKNLTNKITSLLVWANKYCHQVPFIIKVDDDVLIKPDMFYNLLENFLNNTVALNSLIGNIYVSTPPSRIGKYAVPVHEFKGVFPQYLEGPTYILPCLVIPKLIVGVKKTS